MPWVTTHTSKGRATTMPVTHATLNRRRSNGRPPSPTVRNVARSTRAAAYRAGAGKGGPPDYPGHVTRPEPASVLSAPSGALPSAEGTDEAATTELVVSGMHCNACATRIERALAERPGVLSASVNLATNRAFVSYDATRAGPDDLCRAVDAVGYGAVPTGAGPEQSRRVIPTTGACGRRCRGPWRWRRWRWPCGAPGRRGRLGRARAGRCGRGGGRVAVPPRQRPTGAPRRTSMDTLVTVGTLAALAVSAVEAIALGGRHVHLGGSGEFAARLHGVMAPVIVAILVTGRAVEARARGAPGGPCIR